MRDKVYSEKHRKIYRLVNQVLKNSLITKLIHKNQKDDSLEIDTLTGVYNQFAINQFLKELHPQEGKQYGIILFNIDNLNKIKEQYQSEAMNEVLSNVAERLTHNIRETDLVGRLSCSEFILILHDINQEQVTQIAERLLKVMKSNPIKFKSKTIPVQFSYGTSVSGQKTTKSEEVLEQADQNRFIGKGQTHSFYSESQILS
ncbi:diguanylate cyclase [Acinetobacter defluvii]|uniref:GGDEF domain-containing protein n=1 Tax=Acinetobacter defluvii TaxID=1871111 RepID=UPI00149030E8|nr:GGDEF domain-containing protein [Acinetobacter defluvii]NNP73263.1 diguanylate cyclase [Acinetobacter defluvii]